MGGGVVVSGMEALQGTIAGFSLQPCVKPLNTFWVGIWLNNKALAQHGQHYGLDSQQSTCVHTCTHVPNNSKIVSNASRSKAVVHDEEEAT